MKKEKRTPALSANGIRFGRRLILLLTFGVALLGVLLSALYQILIANFGTDSPVISVFYYLIEVISVCSLFCFMGCALYLLFSTGKELFLQSVLIYGLSGLAVSVLFNALTVYLLALANDRLDLPFDISNYPLSFLERDQLMYIVSMSFLSVLSTCVILGISSAIALRIRNRAQSRLCTPELLAKELDTDNPLQKPCFVFICIFSLVGFALRIYDTVNTVISIGAPRLITEYVYLITPYFMLLVYVLAGYFALQYFMKWFCARMLELSK